MAFGFPPKYVENLPLNGLTKNQFLSIAVEVLNNQSWELNFISESGLIANTNKGIFSWNAEIEIKFGDGYAIVKSSSVGNEIVDWNKNKKTVENFLSTFRKLKANLSEEDIAAKCEELMAISATPDEDFLKLPTPSSTEQFIAVFKPAKNYVITPVLIDLNILLFILMICSGANFFVPDSESLLNWGANFRPLTLEGQWWRLLTNCFLHIGIFHLVMNMFALVYIGALLEPLLGKTRFISAYLLTGIAASVASLWWYDLTISAGASGAIFGMYGVFLAMLTTNLIEKNTRKELLISIVTFVVYNLINGLKGGIDNAAHIGGLIGGIFIGYAFIPSLKKPESKNLKFSSISILVVLILSSSFIVYKNTTNDTAKYDEKMNQFFEMEKMALEIYSAPADITKDQMLTLIKDKGIYYWNQNIKLIDELDKLNLPEELYEKNKVLRQYCELRIKNYELFYKSISEETQKYQTEITYNEDHIRAIITNLDVAREELEQSIEEEFENSPNKKAPL